MRKVFLVLGREDVLADRTSEAASCRPCLALQNYLSLNSYATPAGVASRLSTCQACIDVELVVVHAAYRQLSGTRQDLDDKQLGRAILVTASTSAMAGSFGKLQAEPEPLFLQAAD